MINGDLDTEIILTYNFSNINWKLLFPYVESALLM